MDVQGLSVRCRVSASHTVKIPASDIPNFRRFDRTILVNIAGCVWHFFHHPEIFEIGIYHDYIMACNSAPLVWSPQHAGRTTIRFIYPSPESLREYAASRSALQPQNDGFVATTPLIQGDLSFCRFRMRAWNRVNLQLAISLFFQQHQQQGCLILV